MKMVSRQYEAEKLPFTIEDIDIYKGYTQKKPGASEADNLRFISELRKPTILSVDSRYTTNKASKQGSPSSYSQKKSPTQYEAVPSFYEDDFDKYMKKKNKQKQEAHVNSKSMNYLPKLDEDVRGDIRTIQHLLLPRLAGPGGQDSVCHPVTHSQVGYETNLRTYGSSALL